MAGRMLAPWSPCPTKAPACLGKMRPDPVMVHQLSDHHLTGLILTPARLNTAHNMLGQIMEHQPTGHYPMDPLPKPGHLSLMACSLVMVIHKQKYRDIGPPEKRRTQCKKQNG